MSVTMTLTVTQGFLVVQEFVLRGPGQFIIGRAEGCDVRLPTDHLHYDVSRRHCAINVDAEGCWVRDLGSLNGTLVNGTVIGKRSDEQVSGGHDLAVSPPHPLRNGDEVRVGLTVFRVSIVIGADVPELDQVPVIIG
jgi:pSer/pThr/pTyr-binding forkhead associated (FHA) protein